MGDPASRACGMSRLLMSYLLMKVKIEHVEQVADGRHVVRHVRVGALNRIGQVIAAAIAESGVEHPVPFHEFHERGMLTVGVADMAAG
jgi:hypothetical protein